MASDMTAAGTRDTVRYDDFAHAHFALTDSRLNKGSDMAIWPIFSKSAKEETSPEVLNRFSAGPDPVTVPAVQRRPMRFEQLIEGMGNFDHFDNHDRALKFWLPEPAREALEDLARRQGQSMSELLRQFLFQHCYGVYAHVLMLDKRKALLEAASRAATAARDADPPRFSRSQSVFSGGDEPQISFSRSSYQPKKDPTYWVPELGKNVTSLKIWMSNQMYADLEALAKHSQITVSQYVREIVISRLLGHGTLPKRPEMLEAVPLPSAERWETGQDVQMRQVTFEEYQRHGDGRTEE